MSNIINNAIKNNTVNRIESMTPENRQMEKEKRGPVAANGGFSLIELAVIMMILGIMMAGFLHWYKIRTIQKQREQMNATVFTIADGMSKYLSANGAYPCPSKINVPSTDPDYGVATDCSVTGDVAVGSCSAVHGYCVALSEPIDHDGDGAEESPTPPVSYRIRIGALPFKSMNIGKEDVIDSYNNRFTYAVAEPQAVPATYNEEYGAAIRLEDVTLRFTGYDGYGYPTYAVDNNDRLVDMVFLSHGENEAGSYSVEGVRNGSVCADGGLDSENCDNDATFISKKFADHASGSGIYDDFLVSDLASWVYIWDLTSGEDESIYNRNYNNMGIGTEEPIAKLHVATFPPGEPGADPVNFLVRDENGEDNLKGGHLQASGEICPEEQAGAPVDCFPVSALGGDVHAGGGMECDSNRVMSRIAHADADCKSVLGDITLTCPDFSFVTGFDVDGDRSEVVRLYCRNYITGDTSSVP